MINNRLKLLLVGNHRDHLEPLKSLLFDTLPEHHLCIASNAEQGLALAQIEDPDLIIVDVALPEMEAFKICQKLKADQGFMSIPVVFLTAPETDQTSLAKAFDAGADALLCLPIDPFSFKTQVRAMARLKAANLKADAAVAAKDFLANIINNMGQPVFVKDEQHRFLLVNDAFCTLFDLNREQIIGKTLAENVPLNEHERITKIDKKVLSDGKMSIVEESLTVHEHVSMLFLTTKTRYINKNGEKFLVVVVQDITQQKKAEAESHSKDIQFKKLSDNIPDLIFQFTRRLDGSYCVPIASKGIENIFGCTPEDVKEDFTAIAQVLHPDDSARVINEIEYSAKHLTYFICEFRVQIPGRDIQWILSRSKPEKLPDGSITWFGFNVDITKQKFTEQKLQEYQQRLEQVIDLKTDELQTSERHFRHLVEGVKQDYFFFTIGPEGVLTYLSPSAETFFGQDMDKLLGKSGNELLHLENEGPLYHGDLGVGEQDPPPF